MNAKHTHGPWKYEEGTKTIRSQKENYWLATMDSWDGAVNNKANAARIIACVNACEGINPEAVPNLLEACRLISRLADGQGRANLLEVAGMARLALRKAEMEEQEARP